MNENYIQDDCFRADMWGEKVQEHDTDSAKVSRAGEWQGGEEKPDLLVTIILKQAGFYGTQLQFAVKINADSDLLRAVDKEREGGKEPTELLLGSIAAAVRAAILPLVS